jgi:hypothetical protein
MQSGGFVKLLTPKVCPTGGDRDINIQIFIFFSKLKLLTWVRDLLFQHPLKVKTLNLTMINRLDKTP